MFTNRSLPKIVAALALVQGAASVQAQEASTTTVAAPAAQSTTTVSEAAPTVKIPVPKFLLLHTSGMKMSDANSENPNVRSDVSAINSFRMTWNLTQSSSLRLAQDFSHTWGPKKDGNSAFTLADPYVQIANSKLLSLPAGIELNLANRLYLPASASSQRKSVGAALRTYVELKKSMLNNKLDVSYFFVPQVNVLNNNAYNDEKQALKTNSPHRIWQYLEAGYKVTDKISLVQDLGLKRIHFLEDARVKDSGNSKEFLFADTSISYTVNKNLELALGLSSDEALNLLTQERDFSMYRADETDYYLQASISF